MSGFYVKKRGWRDHPVFRDNKERYAWDWCIESANFKQTKYRYKSKMFLIDRGQIPTSYRTLESKLEMSITKIRNMFDLWIDEGMIQIDTSRGFVLITLMNYDEHQLINKKNDSKDRSKTGKTRGNGTHDLGEVNDFIKRGEKNVFNRNRP